LTEDDEKRRNDSKKLPRAELVFVNSNATEISAFLEHNGFIGINSLMQSFLGNVNDEKVSRCILANDVLKHTPKTMVLMLFFKSNVDLSFLNCFLFLLKQFLFFIIGLLGVF
jgi:hypothetical protein